jgi:hypothetical protein
MARQSKSAVASIDQQDLPTLHTDLPLIEVTETWLLDTIMADSTAGRAIVLRLSDRIAVVMPGQLDALLTRLRKLGHVPRVLEE